MHLNLPKPPTCRPDIPPVHGTPVFHKTVLVPKRWGPLVHGTAEEVVSRVLMTFTSKPKPGKMLSQDPFSSIIISTQSLWVRLLCGQRHFRVSSLEMEGVQEYPVRYQKLKHQPVWMVCSRAVFQNPTLWLHIRKAGINKCVHVCMEADKSTRRQTWNSNPARGNMQSRLRFHLRWTMPVSETGLMGWFNSQNAPLTF